MGKVTESGGLWHGSGIMDLWKCLGFLSELGWIAGESLVCGLCIGERTRE